MTDLLTPPSTPATRRPHHTIGLPATAHPAGIIDADVIDDDGVWLPLTMPTTRLGRLLCTEITHPGVCYTGRCAWALVASTAVGVAAELSYAGGHWIHTGAPQLPPAALTAAITIITTVISLAAVLLRHARWHRADIGFTSLPTDLPQGAIASRPIRQLPPVEVPDAR